MTFDNLLRSIGNDKKKAIEYFRDVGILKKFLHCDECNSRLRDVEYKRHCDGLAFRCYKSTCSKKQLYVSIRKHSFFDSFNADLMTIFTICYKWFNDNSIIEIKRSSAISKNLILKIFKLLRENTKKYFDKNPVRLGGVGVVCQIDESMFRYRQKYHRGRNPDGERWVFGIVDTSCSPASYFVQLVENRSCRILFPIINNVVKSGSIIWSDEWRAYRTLTQAGFEHYTINHSLNFVDPITGVNTQTVESLWNRLKRRLKKLMGFSLESLKEHLIEWMWKDNINRNNLQKLIELIRLE